MVYGLGFRVQGFGLRACNLLKNALGTMIF